MPLLFVYGTLKKGCKNHRVLNGIPLKAKAITNGELINLGPFPGFTPMPANSNRNPVQGELYEVTDDQLRRFDRFEGVPSLYFRQEIPVIDETGLHEMAYVYVVTQATIKNFNAEGRIIPSGEWVE